MSRKTNIREYPSDSEDRESGQVYFNEEDNDYDVEQQQDDYSPEDWEENYEEEQDWEIQADRERVECDAELAQPLSAEEFKSFQEATKPKVTAAEMDAEYEQFLEEERAKEQAKEQAMIDEISAWVEKGHQVHGETLDEHFADMQKQKQAELEQWEAERKVKWEAERKAAREHSEKVLAAVADGQRKAAADRDRTKFNRPNAKGKFQGQKATLSKGKRALLKEKQEKVKETKSLIMVVPKPKIVKLEDIIGDSLPNEEEDEIEVPAPAVQTPVVDAPKPEPKPEPTSQILSLIAAKEEESKAKEAEAKSKADEDAFWKTIGRAQVAKTGKPKKILLDITPHPRQKHQTCDPVDIARRAGFDALAKAGQTENKHQLACTRLCNSVIDGSKCPHGSKCRFAHSVDQLARKECAFGPACKFCKQVTPGIYRNIPAPRGPSKVCNCWHPEETVASYSTRMSLKSAVQTKPAPVSEPIKLELKKPAVQSAVQTKAAPWAPKVSQEPKIAQAVTPVPTPRKSRWDERPAQTVTVIRVPKEMAKAAMEAAIARGVQNFRVELI